MTTEVAQTPSHPVRHAGRTAAFRARLSLLEGARTSWVQMARAGEFRGHPAGPFVLDERVFRDVVRNFERQRNPVPVTYEHPAYDGDGQPIPAAGWVLSIEVRGSGDDASLWGEVEWTPRAERMIRDGEYRYCSVVIVFDSIDRETGEEIGAELLELGLTNVPFIDGMEPIRLSAIEARQLAMKERRGGGVRREMSMDPNKVLATIAKALGLSDETSPEKIKAAVEAFVAFVRAMGADTPSRVEEMDEAAMSRLARLARRVSLADVSEADYAAAMEIATKLMDATGLDATALLAAVIEKLDALAALLLSGPDAGGADAEAVPEMTQMSRLRAELAALRARDAEASRRLAELSREVEALRAREREAERAALEARVTRLVDDAVSSGKALAGEREHLMRLARVDFAACEAMLAARVPSVPTAPLALAGAPARSGGGDAAEPRNDDEQRHYRRLTAAGLRGESLRRAMDDYRARVSGA